MTTPDHLPAVVIPTHHRPEQLVAALSSVLAQTVLPREVVVVDVDGASWSPASAAVAELADLPVRRVVLPGPAYAGAARNAGARATDAAVLAFLDDDDVWAAGYLEQALSLLTDTCSAVVTPLLMVSGDRRGVCPGGLTLGRADAVLARNPGVTGSNLVLRRDVFHAVGGFDPLLAAFNDLDLLVRLLDADVQPAVAEQPYAEHLAHEGERATAPSQARLEALTRYMAKHGSRMSPQQRLHLLRERMWMKAHLARLGHHRLAYRVAQVVMTPPQEVVRACLRRSSSRSADA